MQIEKRLLNTDYLNQLFIVLAGQIETVSAADIWRCFTALQRCAGDKRSVI